MLLRKKYFREIAILNRFLGRLGPQIFTWRFPPRFLASLNFSLTSLTSLNFPTCESSVNNNTLWTILKFGLIPKKIWRSDISRLPRRTRRSTAWCHGSAAVSPWRLPSRSRGTGKRVSGFRHVRSDSSWNTWVGRDPSDHRILDGCFGGCLRQEIFCGNPF